MTTATTRPRGRPRTLLSIALADPTRHLHIIEDDEFHHLRLNRMVVQADPKALPVEFFRAGGAA